MAYTHYKSLFSATPTKEHTLPQNLCNRCLVLQRCVPATTLFPTRHIQPRSVPQPPTSPFFCSVAHSPHQTNDVLFADACQNDGAPRHFLRTHVKIMTQAPTFLQVPRSRLSKYCKNIVEILQKCKNCKILLNYCENIVKIL